MFPGQQRVNQHGLSLMFIVPSVMENHRSFRSREGDVYRVMFRVTRRFGESQLLPQMLGLCRSCSHFSGPFEEDQVLGRWDGWVRLNG